MQMGMVPQVSSTVRRGWGGREGYRRGFWHAQVPVPLWVFGSEVVTLIELCNSPLKPEGKKKKKKSKPKESMSAQREPSWSLLSLLG